MTSDPESPCIHDWVFWHAEQNPGAPAVTTQSAMLTYGELAGRIRALAVDLATAGIAVGDRVLVALPNTPATIVVSLAVQLVGATAVEVNREWSAEVLSGIVARSGVRGAFVWARDAATWQTVLAEAPVERLWVVQAGPTARDTAARLADHPATPVGADGIVASAPDSARPVRMAEPDPDRPSLVLYTSGSTGRPHGVIQTIRNVDANTRSIVRYLGLTARDKALLALPLYYCYGRSVLQTHLFVGASVHLDNRFAYPRVVMEALASEGCTGFAGVPLTYEIIRRQVDVRSIGFPRLRYLTQAGGAMAPDTIDWVREAFRPALLYVMYGQTEATARLSYLPPDRAVDKRGSIGIPIPGVELRVMDEQGTEQPPGEIGELVARGDNVTPGYLDEPEETAAILHDGWLWTGDLAVRDADGYFFHRGRAKDILKVGGHRVSPIQIEQEIERHPDVAEAAVVGRPDALMGQVPIAYVVPRAGASPDAAALQRFCHDRMPGYQVPVEVLLVASLPRNEFGKLLRSQLTPLEHAATGAAGAPAVRG